MMGEVRAGKVDGAYFQDWNGIVYAIHLVGVNEVTMEINLRYRIPEPLWKRFKNALDRVGAETAGAVLRGMTAQLASLRTCPLWVSFTGVHPWPKSILFPAKESPPNRPRPRFGGSRHHLPPSKSPDKSAVSGC